MATSNNKSQGIFLAAVLLASQKPNPPKVLRSSLYPILSAENSPSSVDFREAPFNNLDVYLDTSPVRVSTVLALVDVRKDYDHLAPDTLSLAMDFDLVMTYETTFDGSLEVDGDNLALEMNFDINMTYVHVTYIDYVEPNTDNLVLAMDFDLVMTKS